MNLEMQAIETIGPLPSLYTDEDIIATRCTHPGLRTFTFSDGKTIQSCPACTKFDKPRRDVLGHGRVFDMRNLASVSTNRTQQ
jgi:hypothetical protein